MAIFLELRFLLLATYVVFSDPFGLPTEVRYVTLR